MGSTGIAIGAITRFRVQAGDVAVLERILLTQVQVKMQYCAQPELRFKVQREGKGPTHYLLPDRGPRPRFR
jgi:hypothetical protein